MGEHDVNNFTVFFTLKPSLGKTKANKPKLSEVDRNECGLQGE